MHASEVFKKPGDVARRKSNGTIGIAYRSEAAGELFIAQLDSDGMWSFGTMLRCIEGDWEPLGPCVDISSLSHYHADGTLLHSSDPRAAFVLKKQVENHCIVDNAKVAESADLRAQAKRVKQLEAACEELDTAVDELQAENDELRGRLAELQPEPEIPKVPKCLRIEHCHGCVHDVDDSEVVGMFVTLVEGDRIHVMYADCGVGDYDKTQMAIYEGPVEWPDGTIAPVPVSDELREALGDG